MAKTETSTKKQKVARYRCPNNVFLYCDTEPDWQTNPTPLDIKGEPKAQYKAGGKCKQDWHTCQLSRSLSEIIGDLSMITTETAPRSRRGAVSV